MELFDDTINGNIGYPPSDGIYGTDFDPQTQRGNQWRNRAQAIDVNDRIPDNHGDERFQKQAIIDFGRSWQEPGPLDPSSAMHVPGGYFWDLSTNDTVDGMTDRDVDPGNHVPYDANLRLVRNLRWRIEGFKAWQAHLARHYTNLFRVVIWKWNPGQIVQHGVSMANTMYRLKGSWQRVNRLLRENAGYKSAVEADAAVRQAANRMDDIIDAWRDQQGIGQAFESTSQDGNRFPCPKRWWIGHLETRIKVDDANNFDGAVVGQRYRDVFEAASTPFRHAVADVIVAHQMVDDLTG